MNSSLQKFLALENNLLFSGNLAILCNQSSFDYSTGKYLFQILNDRKVLRKIFIPEHGLFAELQDQVKLNQTNNYDFFNLDIPFISLYGSSEKSIHLKKEYLYDLDVLVIDIQDVGCRYYTFLSTINNIFSAIKKHASNIKVYVIDKPNPAGRQVEGTRLQEEYASFIGIPGIPNRHGLTIGELCKYLRSKLNATFELEVITFEENEFYDSFQIAPSPNLPSTTTAQLYSGQCLFEGTILSEGRGTTQPFQIIGAPFLSWKILNQIQRELFENYPYFKNKIALRPLIFIPTFHKYSGENCKGFQLHILQANFHSLLFSLLLIQIINRLTDTDIWKKSKYEFGSDKSAIEILVGDKKIIKCLQNSGDFKKLIPYIQDEENIWIETVKRFLIYPYQLSRQNISEKI